MSNSTSEGKVETYPDEGDGIEEALYEEGVSGDARKARGRAALGSLSSKERKEQEVDERR